jgi:uncharacterized protein with NRDE domain
MSGAAPAEPAHWWDDPGSRGRDLEAGGTWMGITREGRFAAVTPTSAIPPTSDPPPARAARS